MRKSVLFGIPLILIVFSMLAVDFSSAVSWDKTEWDMVATYTDDDDRQNWGLHHSSGKYVYAYYDRTANHLEVKIFSQSGSLDATVNQAVTLPYTEDDTVKIKVFDINTTAVGIALAGSYTNTNTPKFYVIEVGVNSYVSECRGGTSYAGITQKVLTSPLGYNQHDGKHYFTFIDCSTTTGGVHSLTVKSYDPVTRGTSSIEDFDLADYTCGGASQLPPVLTTSHPNDTEYIYVASAYFSNDDVYVYHWIDLEGSTTEVLATHPNPDRTTPVDVGKTYNLYGGNGVVVNGDDIYLYYTWINPRLVAGTTRTMDIIQHRLRFNVTIESAEFEAQEERHIALTPNVDTGSTVCWVWGYMDNNNKSRLVYMTPTKIAGSDSVYQYEHDLREWFDMSGTYEIEVNDVQINNIYIPFVNDDDFVTRDPASKFQVNIDYTTAPDEADLYYDCLAYYADYDVTLSYLPADNPPETNTVYTFTITLYKNGIQTQMFYILYVDYSQYRAELSEPDGTATFTFSTFSAGIHTFRVDVYDDPTVDYTESFSYTFSQLDLDPEGDPAVLVPTTIFMMQSVLPLLFLYLVPTIPLGKWMGSQGVILGVVIGTTFSVATGYIPTYMVFLVGLCVSGYFVYRTR